MSSTIEIRFKSEFEAREMFDTIQNWLRLARRGGDKFNHLIYNNGNPQEYVTCGVIEGKIDADPLLILPAS